MESIVQQIQSLDTKTKLTAVETLLSKISNSKWSASELQVYLDLYLFRN